MRQANYDKFPCVEVQMPRVSAWQGWEDLSRELQRAVAALPGERKIVALECYPGVLDAAVLAELPRRLGATLVNAADCFKSAQIIDQMVEPYVTDDPVFGKMTYLTLADFFDPRRLAQAREMLSGLQGTVLVYGIGATLIASQPDLLLYADMARWEAQMRFRRNEISNLGVQNAELKWSLQYKRAFFVDWRVADNHKKGLFSRIDYLLDTHQEPRMITGEALRSGLKQAAARPFRVVPFFDPAPWGGQWMKEVCDLDRSAANYGWCFDCVPEENSLLLKFGGIVVEIPSINLVFQHPRELLGEAVHGRFGTEFPIRFDFLDTMGGGNLSFQVHPLTEYIQEKFGMHYTQDESYYMLDAGEGASVYLGLNEQADPAAVTRDLILAQKGEKLFPADDYVQRWPARKHDHFLIPAGTCHCSGGEAMVLEISATPYIFTFKMWDWGRMGLDGKPRHVHLQHALANVQWERRTEWVGKNLVNHLEPLGSGPGWREERTGLHEREFIETRRHWFTAPVEHDTHGGVNVLNLVEGSEAVVESPDGAFAPFVVHYAETFIVPAAVGRYRIRPLGSGMHATLKAFVR